MAIRRRIMQGAGLATAVLLGACTQVEVRYPDGRTQTMSRAEFKAYAETVFRRQNRVVDRLIRADVGLGDEGLAADARLLRAEEAMDRRLPAADRPGQRQGRRAQDGSPRQTRDA
jgi:hypothetical protein